MKDVLEFSGEFRFLSNFHPAAVELDGRVYTTVEHAYQAAKTTVEEERWHIRHLQTPGQAKRAGRKVTPREDWESVKIDVMRALVREKFFEHRELGSRLLATGDVELVEGNTWGDRFWGMCEDTGLNWLGRILMDVRGELRSRSAG
jgi:ribA/ribD-fused uncharacterized protein